MEKIEKVCENYSLLCGIEEEMLIISEDGTLVPVADYVMRATAELLNRETDRLERLQLRIRSLDPEPHQAQIEYVTLPVKLEEVPDCIKEGRELLIDAINSLGYKAFIQSLHPIQSDPHPMCGTHINISTKQSEKGSMTAEEMLFVYNHLWNHLPELIALSANTPIYNGEENGIMSNRLLHSTVMKPNSFGTLEIPSYQPALVQEPHYGTLRYSLKLGRLEEEPHVITNPRGDRLMDITPRGPYTNIDQDKEDSIFRNRIEIRIFDNQRKIESLLDIVSIVSGLTLEALCFLQDRKRINAERFHFENREEAIRNGMDSTFLKEINGRTSRVSARDQIKEMIKRTEDHRKALSTTLSTDLRNGIPEVEAKKPKMIVKVATPKFEKLRQKGRRVVTVRFSSARRGIDPRTDRKYRISKNHELTGELRADFKLTYEEQNGFVTDFNEILLKNNLSVQNVKIPLKDGDEILGAMTEEDYMFRRIFRRPSFLDFFR